MRLWSNKTTRVRGLVPASSLKKAFDKLDTLYITLLTNQLILF